VVTLLLSAVLGCGPELTDPSSTNISGNWTSNDVIGPLSSVSLNVEQASDGSVQGQWAGVTSPNVACPPGLGVTPTGPVSGSNTIFALQMSLVGAGEFDGQVPDQDTMRGSFASCGVTYSVTFTRAEIVP